MKNLKIVLLGTLFWGLWLNAGAYNFEVDGFYYDKTSDSTVTLVHHESYDTLYGAITIPGYIIPYNGVKYRVKTIDYAAFSECNLITKITVDDPVQQIGSRAFEFCENLTEVTIGRGVQYISSAIFMGCDNLQIINFNADSIALTESCYKYSGFCDNTDYYTRLKNNWLYGVGDRIKQINIGDSVRVIPWYFIGFQYNYTDSVEYMEIPNSVVKAAAFRSTATGVKKVKIGNGIRYTIPYGHGTNPWVVNHHTEGSPEFFNGCENLETVILEEGSLYVNGFNNYPKITSIDIPKSAIDIAGFSGCTGLTELYIPSKVEIVGGFNNTGLTEITIPDNVKTLSKQAFSNNENLKVIKIGKGVTTFGEGVFSGCYNVDTIYCMTPFPQVISTSAFENVDKETCILVVGCQKSELYSKADIWREFKHIEENCDIDGFGESIVTVTATTQEATDITETSAVLHGDVTAEGGDIDSKGFLYKKSSDKEFTAIDVTAEDMVYTLTELEKETEYTYKVFAVADNDTTSGEEKTFKTLQGSGIDEVVSGKCPDIYPNPAKNTVTVDLGNLTSDNGGTVTIINNAGVVVYQSDIQSQKFNINIENWDSGIYYIKTGKFTQKLIIE